MKGNKKLSLGESNLKKKISTTVVCRNNLITVFSEEPKNRLSDVAFLAELTYSSKKSSMKKNHQIDLRCRPWWPFARKIEKFDLA